MATSAVGRDHDITALLTAAILGVDADATVRDVMERAARAVGIDGPAVTVRGEWGPASLTDCHRHRLSHVIPTV